MSAVFGFFYHLFPAARQNKLAIIHFWMHAVGIVVLVVSLYFVLAGNEGVEPVTALLQSFSSLACCYLRGLPFPLSIRRDLHYSF
jgi:small-conductance mechanosensitive channel